jgi:glycogen(starch) synthase
MNVLWLLPSRSASAPSGGDLYDALVIAGLRSLGHRVEVKHTPPATVRADVVVQDELGFRAWLPFNEALAKAKHPARRVALVHVTSARLGARSAAHEARYLASTDAAIFVSRHARVESQRLLGARLRAVAVIPPGADRLPRARRVRATSGLRLLCAGHLGPHKRQLELVRAFGDAGISGATLTLAGDGTVNRTYTARVVAALKQTPGARWVGPLGAGALSRALARSDVFLNASDYESWGMAAAEAQAAGVPVVSSSRGGLWEFLTPGVDSLRARTLSAAVLRRLGDAALVARLTRGARRARVRRWKTVAREFSAFLEATR